jgi:hypothetical protein
LLWNLLLVTVERVKSPRLAMQTPLLKFWRKSLPSQVTSSTRPLFSMLMPLPSRQGLYRLQASVGAPAPIAPVLPAVAVDDVIDELDAADLGHPAGDVDAVALGAGAGQQGRGRAVLGDPLDALGVVADDDVLAQAASIVELDAVAGVLMDDVAVNQQIADLDDPVIKQDAIGSARSRAVSPSAGWCC